MIRAPYLGVEPMHESGWFPGLGAGFLGERALSPGGRVHFSSAFKPNHDAEPVLEVEVSRSFGMSVSVQISTLAVKHSPHYLPDIDVLGVLAPADVPRILQENQPAVFNRSLIPPASWPINQQFNSPNPLSQAELAACRTRQVGSACFPIKGQSVNV